METVVSLMPEHRLAYAGAELAAAGFGPEDIAILHSPGEVWQALNGRGRIRKMLRPIGLGALVGLLIGLLYGVPAAILNCTLMDCSLTIGLDMLVLIGFYWVLGGALLGGIIGLDRLDRALYSYVEGARRGETVVMVAAPPDTAAEAADILAHNDGVVVQALHEEATRT